METLNAARLAEISARVTLMRLPMGKDVTENGQQGRDVRTWVRVLRSQRSQRP